MAEITKHVGRLKNTDARCVVVFMQIPNDKNYALVVDTDSLPDAAADVLGRIVTSSEAKHETELGNLLSRRPSLEPGMDMLTYLHRTNRLRRVPVSNVVMYPFPNQPFPLEEIIKLNGGKIDSKMAPDNTSNPEKYNPYIDRQRAEEAQSKLDIATSKLREAELLDQEARKKREEAYKYFPQLRPGYNPNEDVLEKIVDQKMSNVVTDIQDGEPAFSLEDLGIDPSELGEVILEDVELDDPVDLKVSATIEEPKSRRGRKKVS